MSADKKPCPSAGLNDRNHQSEISRRWAERQRKHRNANARPFPSWTTLALLILAAVSGFHFISVIAFHGRSSAASEHHRPTTSSESQPAASPSSQLPPPQSAR